MYIEPLSEADDKIFKDKLRDLARKSDDDEQRHFLFEAANHMSHVRADLEYRLKRMTELERHWWNEFNVQQKRADDLDEKLDSYDIRPDC